MKAKSPNVYSRFMKREAFILTLAIIFIFVFGIALTVGYSHYKGQIKNTIQRNKLAANLLAALILEHQKAATGIIQSYASRPLLIDAAQKKDFNEIIKHLNHLKENNQEIDSTFITDQEGTLWASFPIVKESYGKNFSYRDWFKGVSKEWKTYVSSVYPMIVGEKDLAVALCAPIFDEKGKAIGILGTSQRVDFLGRMIQKFKLDPGMKITLIDQAGNIIYSDLFAYKKIVISYPFLEPIKKAMIEGKDALEIQDPSESGKVRYMALVPIKEFGWSVIVEKGEKAVLISESGFFIQISVISLLCFLVIAFSLVYFRKEFIHRKTIELLNIEKEMREKERRYSSLLENVNLVAVGLDTNGNITFANPFLLKLTGYALEEILSKNWFDIFISGKDKEDLKRVFNEILLNELFPHYDNPILTKSGEERLIAWNNTILKDIHGQVLGMMSIGEDITERKRAEEALQSSVEIARQLAKENEVIAEIGRIISSTLNIEEIYERFAEEVKKNISFDRIGINIIDPEDHTAAVTYISGINIAGRKKGEVYPLAGSITGEVWRTRSSLLLQPKDSKEIQETIGRYPVFLASFQAGFRSLISVPLVSKNEVIGVLHLRSPQPNAYSENDLRFGEKVAIQISGAIANAQIFAERKRAEEELRERERFNFALFECNPIQTIVVDPEGKVTQFNLAKKKSGDRLPNSGDVMYKDYAGRHEIDMYAELMKCIGSGEEKEFPEQKYGNKVLSITISPFSEGAVITSQDITERKRAEEDRGRLMADLEAKNRELEAFVYTISHDLKAPLVSMNGFSFALQKDSNSQLGKEGKHYVERIQANVAHMDDLITSLLDLSRIGRVVGTIEEIDVGPLLREIRDELAVRIEEAGAEFVVQEPLPSVRADRGRIYQVFVNLIENAVKFRSAERALRIEVGCRQEGGFYRFHVSDNGLGIPPQYHEPIFASFRKLHPEIKGVGIGLALVKKIVEHHGGRVWVESEVGKGSTFYFTILKYGIPSRL